MKKINEIITDIKHSGYEAYFLNLFMLLGLIINYSFFKVNTLSGTVTVCILMVIYAFFGLILIHRYTQLDK